MSDPERKEDSPIEIMDVTSESITVSTDIVERVSSLAISDNENKASKSEVTETSATPTLPYDKTLPPNNSRLDFSEKNIRIPEGFELHAAEYVAKQHPYVSAFSNFMIEEIKADIKTECENLDGELRESTEFKDLNSNEGFEETDYKGKVFPKPILNPTLDIYQNFVRAKAFLQIKYSNVETLNLAENVQEFCSSFKALDSNSVPSINIETAEFRNFPDLQTRVCEYWIFVDFLSRHCLRILSLFNSAYDYSEPQLLNYSIMLTKIYQFLYFRVLFLQLKEQRNSMTRRDYDTLCFLSSNLIDHIQILQRYIYNFLAYSNQ